MGERRFWVVHFLSLLQEAQWPVVARNQFKDLGSLESTCKVLHAWVRAERAEGSKAHSLLAELWVVGRPHLPLSLRSSLLPFIPPPFLCLAASYSLRQSLFRLKPWAQALSCGEHSWVCSASTQNWSLQQSGIIALLFVSKDGEDRG